MARTKAKTTKKTVKKAAKPAAKKVVAAKKANLKVGKTPFKKTEILTFIADATELTRKQVSSVFDALGDVMESHLKKTGPGEFTVPGLMKCKVRRKPATKARKGLNPFTGEEMTFKAKPARNVVKVTPLKRVKEMAS